jgi:hypothetical protein
VEAVTLAFEQTDAIEEHRGVNAFWDELWAGARYWTIDRPDGVVVRGRLSVSAYCASCPRCFKEKEHVMGRYVKCEGCGLTVTPTYRVVWFVLPRSFDRETWLNRLAEAAGNLAHTHPGLLPNEYTVVDLDKWSEFTGERTAWGAE